MKTQEKGVNSKLTINRQKRSQLAFTLVFLFIYLFIILMPLELFAIFEKVFIPSLNFSVGMYLLNTVQC